MLLAVDIGNTSIALGIFVGSRLTRRWRIPTDEDMKGLFKGFERPPSIDGIIISSVVPKVLPGLERYLQDLFDVRPLVVGRDLKYGIPNLYKYPRQVGSDRLVNAVAARSLYGSPLIIVDFGTATTFDLISKDGKYLGGIIAPGAEVSLSALSRAAALLPEVTIRKPKGLLGRETKESMISGAVYGFSALCDGIVTKLRKVHGRKIRVVATGGLAKIIITYCKTIDKVDPWLTLKGLRMIYSHRV